MVVTFIVNVVFEYNNFQRDGILKNDHRNVLHNNYIDKDAILPNFFFIKIL